MTSFSPLSRAIVVLAVSTLFLSSISHALAFKNSGNSFLSSYSEKMLGRGLKRESQACTPSNCIGVVIQRFSTPDCTGTSTFEEEYFARTLDTCQTSAGDYSRFASCSASAGFTLTAFAASECNMDHAWYTYHHKIGQCVRDGPTGSYVELCSASGVGGVIAEPIGPLNTTVPPPGPRPSCSYEYGCGPNSAAMLHFFSEDTSCSDTVSSMDATEPFNVCWNNNEYSMPAMLRWNQSEKTLTETSYGVDCSRDDSIFKSTIWYLERCTYSFTYESLKFVGPDFFPSPPSDEPIAPPRHDSPDSPQSPDSPTYQNPSQSPSPAPGPSQSPSQSPSTPSSSPTSTSTPTNDCSVLTHSIFAIIALLAAVASSM